MYGYVGQVGNEFFSVLNVKKFLQTPRKWTGSKELICWGSDCWDNSSSGGKHGSGMVAPHNYTQHL
jgi:hypothetical protein